jgi:hypothetical protein
LTVTVRIRLSANVISSVSSRTPSKTWRAVRSGWVVVSITRATNGGTSGRIQRAAALVASGIDGISGALRSWCGSTSLPGSGAGSAVIARLAASA